nr:MAG TPA: hypothetical protein [Caudoviricetes sp.]
MLVCCYLACFYVARIVFKGLGGSTRAFLCPTYTLLYLDCFKALYGLPRAFVDPYNVNTHKKESYLNSPLFISYSLEYHHIYIGLFLNPPYILYFLLNESDLCFHSIFSPSTTPSMKGFLYSCFMSSSASLISSAKSPSMRK